MAVNGELVIVLQDTRGIVTRLTYELGTFDAGADDGANYLLALGAADDIRGSLVDVTDANIKEWYIKDVRMQSNVKPADADVTDEAVVSVYLTDPDGEEKLHNLRVPAPIDGVFLSDLRTVDTGNALLQQYVQQVAQHATVSDGDTVDTAQGAGGIKGGYWRSKARK